jgi:hypothetical protein
MIRSGLGTDEAKAEAGDVASRELFFDLLQGRAEPVSAVDQTAGPNELFHGRLRENVPG